MHEYMIIKISCKTVPEILEKTEINFRSHNTNHAVWNKVIDWQIDDAELQEWTFWTNIKISNVINQVTPRWVTELKTCVKLQNEILS